MTDILLKSINDSKSATRIYFKFITRNDTKATGSHQSGYHINKDSWNLFFADPGIKGKNKDLDVEITWQDELVTNSRVIYYGKKTRNEYRLTRFGRGFPFRNEDSIGSLLIIYKFSNKKYKAYVISKDEEIEYFFDSTGISITRSDQLVKKKNQRSKSFTGLVSEFVNQINSFPEAKIISQNARFLHSKAPGIEISKTGKNPDLALIAWIDFEFLLFKALEAKIYKPIIEEKFPSVESLISIANTLLNRRKSRAGKALENHVSAIFDIHNIHYQSQVRTEGNKKPDFIFPNKKSYDDKNFDKSNLLSLAVKTTCKDRWRQILNEADKINTKHLLTLQQGISETQLNEMAQHNVILVVPEPYKDSFPKRFRQKILSLKDFILKVKEKQRTNF